MCLGFESLGFGVEDFISESLGVGVYDLNFKKIRVESLEFRVQNLMCLGFES